MCQRVPRVLCELHHIANAIEALMVGGEHSDDDVGQLNSADAAGVAQPGSAVDENKIKVLLPALTDGFEEFAAAFGKELMPIEALETCRVLRVGRPAACN